MSPGFDPGEAFSGVEIAAATATWEKASLELERIEAARKSR